MGVKLQLLLGLLLFGSVCGSEDNSTNFQNVLSEKIDSTNNAIEKQPKTDTQINLVNKDTQNNPEDNIKNSNQPIENDTHKNQTSSQEELGNNDNSSSNENDKVRQNSSRSINVDKLTSPDFHNNDYSLMRQKFLENIIRKSSTKGYMDFSNFQLTTPKTDYFEEEKQKLEEEYEPEHFTNHHIDDEEHTDEDDHEHLHHDLHMDRLFGETKRTPNSTIDYKEKTKISRNNTLGDNSEHNELTIEKFQNFKFASEYNVTTSDEDDSGKPEMISPRDNIETTTFKDFRTTRKPVTLTKPPTEHNYHILSNNIESETIKAINSLTTEFSTTKRLKGENEIMPKEQTVEENKIGREEITNPPSTENIINFNITNSTTEQNNTTTQKYEEGTETNINIINSTTTERYEQSTTNNKLPLILETTINTTEYDRNETTSTYIETTLKPDTESNTTVNEETTTTIKNDYSTNSYTVDKSSTVDQNKTETTTSLTTEQIETTTSTISHVEETTIETKDTTTKDITTTELTTTDLPTTDITTTDLTTTEFIQNVTTTSDTTEATTTLKENLTDTTFTTESGTRISKAFSFDDTSTVTTESSETTTEALTEKYFSKTDTETSKPTEELTSIKYNTEVFTTTEMKTEVETNTQTMSTTKVTEEDTTVSPATTTTVTVENSPTVNYIHTKSYANTFTTTSSVVTQHFTNYPKFRNASATEETATLSTEEVTSDSSQTPDAGNVGGVEDNKGKIAAIVISTVGAVSLILLAGLLYIMRKRQKRFNYKQRCRPVSLDHYSMDNVSGYNSTRRKAERQSKRSYGNPAFDDPSAVTHPLNFPALAKFATNPEEMKAEFEEVPQINANLSELPEGCETKNRYANVIPLPETRVFLQQIEGYPNSDYINANYVTGPKNTKGYYIACQGPMQNTVDDFWRMVWEQQTKVILMITHLFENGVEKCIDYLPPSEVLDCNRLFGDFQVTLKKRDIKDKYIISDLQLKNMVSNSWREVTHFWYLGWPEKGVPTEENSLIAFLIEARSYMKSATLDKTTAANGNTNASPKIEINPVVVHCSPGTGRTGVVIACDIAIREFEQTRLVDIPKIVYRIRRDRASAVQTKEQYMFIYKVVSLYATKLTGGALDSF